MDAGQGEGTAVPAVGGPSALTLIKHFEPTCPRFPACRGPGETPQRALQEEIGGQVGRAPTGPECCSKSAGCPPGSGRAQRALRPPPGSSWGSAPLSAPRPLQPPAQEGELRLVATRNPRPFPRQGALPTPPPHQTFQLPKGEGEEVDLDDAAKDTPQTPAHPAPQPGGGTLGAGRRGSRESPGPTCGRGWRRCHSRTAGPRRRRQLA